MAGISFSVFKDKILDGSKRQTIRGIRKHPIKEGETLYLWWKQQSAAQCEKLGEAKCIKIAPIKLTKDGVFSPDISIRYYHIDLFAQDDGFNDYVEMAEYFDKHYGLPFEGVLIKWDSIKTAF